MHKSEYNFRLQPIIDNTSHVIFFEVLCSVKKNSIYLDSELYFREIEYKEERRYFKYLFSFLMKLKDVNVSINLSIESLHDDSLFCGLSKVILNLKKKRNVNVAIELSEYTIGLIGNITNQLKVKVETLQEIGVEFWVDDFGSYQSNFDIFNSFLFDRVKIDKAFFWSLYSGNAVYLASTINYLHSKSRYGIIIEGIETEEQWLFSNENNCLSQGYFISELCNV